MTTPVPNHATSARSAPSRPRCETARRAALSLAIAGLTLATGCYGPTVAVEPLSPPEVFPYAAAPLETVDVQVFRNGPVLELVNHTPRTFPLFVLWLNERYAAVVPGLEAGATIRVDSRSFVDEYGEPFRGGGIFAAYLPDPVVKAEIERAEGLIALEVVPPAER